MCACARLGGLTEPIAQLRIKCLSPVERNFIACLLVNIITCKCIRAQCVTTGRVCLCVEGVERTGESANVHWRWH